MSDRDGNQAEQQYQAARMSAPLPSSSMTSWSPHQQQQYQNQVRMQFQQSNMESPRGYTEPNLLPSMYQSYPTYPQQQINYHQPHPLQFDQTPSQYQSNVSYRGRGVGVGNIEQAHSVMQLQQPYYSDPLQSSHYMSALPPGRQPNSIKSPRQQFNDTLRRGVQSFAYNPTGASNGDQASDETARSSLSPASRPPHHPGALPARPDLAIRASQGNLSGDNGVASASQSQYASQSHGPQSGSGLSSLNQLTGTPRPAPTVPLSSRFPPLPPKPSLANDADLDKEEMRKLFEAREEALLLRIDALGFQPEAAWEVMNEANEENGDVKDSSQGKRDREKREKPAPILGIRLLQRLDLLQRENEELEVIFAKRMQGKEESELQDAHRLIAALDKALTMSEVKAASSERALAAACAQVSSSITEEPSEKTSKITSILPPWKR